MNTPTECELRELGLTAAADEIKAKRELARKLRIAFEFFRVVTQEQISRFQTELMKRTRKGDEFIYTYDKLKFTLLHQYGSVPPAPVLEALRAAQAHECFDFYEVAEIESVKVIPDPILFGRINGSLNRFYIAQWDNDVKIEDILREDEG